MARQRRAPAAAQQRQASAQAVRQAPQTEQAHGRRRKFDGQRNAVDTAADLAHGGDIGIRQHKTIGAGGSTFGKELHRCVGQRLVGAQRQAGRRQAQGTQPLYPFALDAQSLAACRQQVDALGTLQQLLGQFGGRDHEMLAVVQHQQQAGLVLQVGGERRDRVCGGHHDAERRGQRLSHQPRLAQRSKLNEDHLVALLLGKLARHCQRNTGLANAAGPDERDAALQRDTLANLSDRLVAADNTDQRKRQARHRRSWRCLCSCGGRNGRGGRPGQGRFVDFRAFNRRDKAVAAQRHV